MSVSRETLLATYAGLLRKWNPVINLIAPSTVDNIEERHLSDCCQLVSLTENRQGFWGDLGSGGGLPGLVLAIGRPDVEFTLIESDRRKATFLRSVARELALDNVKVCIERIEKAPPLNATNVSARALAPLPLLMSYAHRHLVHDGRAWLMKGRNWKSEVMEARKTWAFRCVPHASKTDPEAAILEISDIRHA